ncbi:hypothetical protein LV478_00415 (plasmid) [Komagataeibacter oboediens]|uniref:hypothetical protein n=1 Tax=Komagataeibacter oboediens TaxID=65958 RepID=UPI0023DB745C|nr:hypothetical protein [Komagataeibacter oboediens]WEQ50722.1 hypothetical protein LV478_00415 [Komagataeibacter oboediens]
MLVLSKNFRIRLYDRLNEKVVVLPAAPAIRFLAKVKRFHFRPLGICQYEAIHMVFETYSETLKKHNSQQAQENFRERRLVAKKWYQKKFYCFY